MFYPPFFTSALLTGILPLFVQWSDVNLAHHTTGTINTSSQHPLLNWFIDTPIQWHWHWMDSPYRRLPTEKSLRKTVRSTHPRWPTLSIPHPLNTTDGKSEVDTFRPLLDMLRDDVLYMVVSQANYGLKFLAAARPNVLIMNSGESLTPYWCNTCCRDLDAVNYNFALLSSNHVITSFPQVFF